MCGPPEHTEAHHGEHGGRRQCPDAVPECTQDDRQRVPVLPILAGGPPAVLLAEAVIHVVIGLVIAVLVANAASSALRYSG